MKILFVPFAPSLAHITRCLSVAETMKSEGNDCFFAVGIEGKNIIEKAGFGLAVVPEVDSETFKKEDGRSLTAPDELLQMLEIIEVLE